MKFKVLVLVSWGLAWSVTGTGNEDSINQDYATLARSAQESKTRSEGWNHAIIKRIIIESLYPLSFVFQDHLVCNQRVLLTGLPIGTANLQLHAMPAFKATIWWDHPL